MYKLIFLLSFLIPFQTSYHFKQLSVPVYGFTIDYLIPAVYLTDLVMFLTIIFGIYKLKIKLNFKLLFIILLYLSFIIINLYQSGFAVFVFYKWLKVTEIILFGFILLKIKKFDVFNYFVLPLSLSTVIVTILGITQFLLKGSVGGVFYYLGERSFLFSNPNIAPYPYSTFSHPNSFAGFLLVYLIYFLNYRKKFRTLYFFIVLTLILINLILTNSLNVYITIVVLLILKFKNYLTSFFMLIPLDITQRYITHRIELIEASWKMIKTNFWFGVGFNNFIPNLVKVSNTYLNSWELQPVHNIFLLIFSELGIFGLIVFIFLLLSLLGTTSYTLIAILITGQFDHYWLTLQQNMILFVYVLVITKIDFKNKKFN